MESPIVIIRPVCVQFLMTFSRESISGVKRRQFEITSNDMVDCGQYGRIRVDPVEIFTLVHQVCETARARFLMNLCPRGKTLLIA